jgi:hypothetical protein
MRVDAKAVNDFRVEITRGLSYRICYLIIKVLSIIYEYDEKNIYGQHQYKQWLKDVSE